ncbi:MAG: glutamine-hydrolyzing carbamoyl-phosphate synthase small subunit [Chloroflexota bacterium]|nr:glutamine-hydrolyzing carbamoyl-phosphate synthase small subunit [Chloroflexota bacterium]MDE2946425.1 glutamine-hydrolyzing carbamoyl-phosphate synthase small subunit [Chloroflexota bacterium]
MKAVLVLEDGRVFPGEGFGAEGISTGEIVFNTAMTGYQEILTDPSYHRQIVAMTVPHVGNTGVNLEDPESAKVWAAGFVVRSLSPIVSNWRNRGDLASYLEGNGIIGISSVATRALVRHIRELGVMRAALAHGREAADIDRLVETARSSPDMAGANLVDDVSVEAPYDWAEASDAEWYSKQRETATRSLVVAYDYGIKRNILRMMTDRGLRVKVVPAWTPPSEILSMEPAGVFLSNGPGDPAAVDYAIANVQSLLGQVPIFGICLGHQILALALGGETEKMRFGHRGGNQPVKHLASGEVEIASHNHGFAVSADSNLDGGEVTHLNLNDNTVAGLRHGRLRAFSVQYHPEASPGPHDSFYLFDEFVDAVSAGRRT